MIPSAGILSPVCRSTKSFTTTSSIGISVILFSLFTLHFNFDDSSCNLLKASSLPYSDNVEIKEAINIAITIPNVSNQSKS